MNIKKILPTRVEGTRWLPHVFRAINVLIKGYRGLRAQLENSSHANAKAEGFAKIIPDVAVITFILTLKVNLQIFNPVW